MNYKQKDVHRFYSHIISDITNLDICWEMDLFHDKNNYPMFRLSGKSERACRVSYTIHYGQIPPDMQIRHMCHNPKCVNYNHLKYGTAYDNKYDSIIADRHAKGDIHGKSILTDSLVTEIITRIWNNEFNNIKEVAKEYNVNRSTINNIFERLTWTHITDKLVVPLDDIRLKILKEYNQGNSNPNSKLTEADVIDIKKRIKSGESIRSIHKKYNIVCCGYLYHIKQGKYWSNIIV